MGQICELTKSHIPVNTVQKMKPMKSRRGSPEIEEIKLHWSSIPLIDIGNLVIRWKREYGQ